MSVQVGFRIVVASDRGTGDHRTCRRHGADGGSAVEKDAHPWSR